ncbi:hypothetical protein KY289_019868 [Solanum tuberosum]|nr:hypothetical protein KY289_019868 [Solanum tuberosum]
MGTIGREGDIRMGGHCRAEIYCWIFGEEDEVGAVGYCVYVGTDCDSSNEENNVGLNSSDRDSEELEIFRKERTQDVNEKLDKFLHLEKGMSFKNLFEAKRIVGFYAVANKVNEKIKNMGEGSSQKVQDVTLTTVHESQTSEQEQQFAQHLTIGDDEWEGEEEDEDENG